MCHPLQQLKQQAEAFNALRTRRAVEMMDKQGQLVFQLLPVLLHYNNSLLPGYVTGDVPHGIRQYEPDEQQSHFIDDLLLTANCEAELGVSEHTILGLYCMGSTGSMGQSAGSDLDVWVCHTRCLPEARRELLESKCMLISKWADSRGVELNFFLIPEDKFRIDNTAEMTKEGCGSAQHFLLLDEFYRSALRVAGLPLLWGVISDQYEEEYDRHVASLYDSGALQPQDWLDLGGFTRIPAEEYFGAALWQLYKGIDSPYKAVLKILLMEAYSADFPFTELISLKAKRRFFQQSEYGMELDGYALMLEQVTEYLQATQDESRLDLARRCFYLKTHLMLSQSVHADKGDWQREWMQTLVDRWGWSAQTVAHLDNRSHWKVEEVRTAHTELLDVMMSSYRNLIRFARQNDISESINPEDIGILSRKLYAAFESLPGKVTLINPKISPDLFEPHLSFIQVPEGRFNRAGWYLYKHALEPISIIGQAPLEHNGYLSKLVAWSYFNGLMTQQTRVQLYNQGSDMDDEILHRFSTDLRNTFPIKVEKASNLALSRPCEIRHLGIFINLESDPTSHWDGQVIEFDANDSDVFSFGRFHECLVGSIDLVYRNSWNEIRTLHFSGDECVVEALTTILGKMHQDARSPDAIDVFCYSQHFRSLLRNRFYQLIRDSIHCRLQRNQQRAVKTLVVGNRKYGVFFERRGVAVRKLENSIDFYSDLSTDKLSRLPLRLDNTQNIKVPAIVESQASEGLVQFFFENNATSFNIYILDETNQVEVYQHFSGNKDELVQGVNRFYTATHEKAGGADSFVNFNLPQFYEIVCDIQCELKVIPYSSQEGWQERQGQAS